MTERILGFTLKWLGIFLVTGAILFEIAWGIVIGTTLAGYDNHIGILQAMFQGCSYFIIYGSLAWIAIGSIYLFECE